MAKRYAGGYEGKMGRDAQERSDNGMMKADSSAMANMPQEVVMKPWPNPYSYLPEDLNDRVSGVDRQIKADAPTSKSGFKPEKLN